MRVRRVLTALVGAIVVGGLAGRAEAAAANCQLQKIVEVPVTMDGLRAHVSARINGHPTTMMIDTGFFFSDLSDEAVERFGLKPSTAPFGLQIRGVGGAARDARAVRADEFDFAGAGFKNIQFLVGGRVGEGDTAGVIGMNVMGPFDVEYDFANGVMRFFKAKDCGDANLAYWSKGMALSRIDIEGQGSITQQIVASAYANGHLIHVIMDSGASLSVLSRNAAARAGVQVGQAGVTSAGISHGIYGGGQETFLAPFASFKIGDEEIKNTTLRLADLRLQDGKDMLLGADFFLSHRILVSNTQKKVYFTYNGGPVFRLDGAAPARQQIAQATPPSLPAGAPPAADATPPASAAPAGETVSASEHQRRGQAMVSRREFPQAIDEFSAAIQLEPNGADHYKARALARLSNRQPVLAMADLDQALRLNAQDVQALTLRGELYLNGRDTARAKADFDAALKLAPADLDLPLTVGGAYARAGQFDLALQIFDDWVAAHPKSLNIARVKGVRCWTRAAANRELTQAMADCDAALREERTSDVMEARGLALLRMGRLDEALTQYNAALKQQPRSAPGLYGRGLVELQKGAASEGKADIAAALAIAPGLGPEYRRFGLGPDGGTGPAAPAAAGATP